jgi:ribosome maturation factor RimP
VSPETPSAFTAKVKELAGPLCEAEGVELIQVEYRRESGGRTLRLYIDRPGGVTLDDCSTVSRQLSDLLDVYLDQEVAYNLEISSPGPDRPLVRNEDFVRFKGNKAKIRTLQPIEGQKNFTGILQGLTEDQVNLRISGNTVMIPLDQVKQARLVNYHGEN